MQLSVPMNGNSTNPPLLLLGMALLTATLCGCGSSAGPAVEGAPSESTPQQIFGPSAWTSVPTHHSWRIITNSGINGAQTLRAAYVQSVQRQLGREYAALPGVAGADSFRFESRPQNLSADLGSDGVRVNVANAEVNGSATFRLTHYGCTSDAGARLAPARPLASSSRVSYSRPGLVEWYQNGRLGLEQGFDLLRPPACRADRPGDTVELHIEVAHSLHASLVNGPDGAQRLELRNHSGHLVLRYSDLYAEDADHKTISAKMALADDALILRIDDSAARYPVQVDPLIWAQLGAAYKSPAPGGGDFLGASIAISGDHAIIGAPFDDEGGSGPGTPSNSGAAYVFQLNSQGTWSQQAKILGAADDMQYGAAVAITELAGGDKRLVIGAPNDSGGSGLANWFRGRSGSWTFEAEFSSTGFFGTSVGVSGSRIIVGAPQEGANDGTARIFEPDITLAPPWAETRIQDLAAPGSAEELGTAVAINGDVAVVGAPKFDTGAGVDAGQAYIYERTASGMWLLTGTLTASDASGGDNFGQQVAVNGLTAVIAAPTRSAAAGGSYVFTDIGGVWSQQARLHQLAGSALNSGDFFGGSVAVSGNAIVIGALSTDAGGQTNSGSAYLFNRTAGVWSLTGTLVSANPAPPHAAQPTAQELFGSSVAIDALSGHILVGAQGNDLVAPDSGSFYDFILRKSLGDPCATDQECAGDLCVDGFCCNSACGRGGATRCDTCSAAGSVGTCSPLAVNTICSAAIGPCETAGTCSGAVGVACSAKTFLSSATMCRGQTGLCDIQENCTGSSASCPVDAVQSAGFTCRAAVTAADGTSCDAPEFCDGQSKACPVDQFKAALTTCRLPGAECDQFEVCTGLGGDCPITAPQADGTSCRAGSCQSGMCRVEADLGIAIAGPTVIEQKKPLSYVVSVSNFGPSPATAVVIDVTLPEGATLTTNIGTGWMCQTTESGTRCTLPLLSAGEVTNISLLISPPINTQRLLVTAAASSMVFDPIQANNTATLDQNLLVQRLSGGGAGCSAAPGDPSGASALTTIFFLLLGALRRRRAH